MTDVLAPTHDYETHHFLHAVVNETRSISLPHGAKTNAKFYPLLSTVSRNVLAIPRFSVASAYLFPIAGNLVHSVSRDMGISQFICVAFLMEQKIRIVLINEDLGL